ncbi:MAG: hypothetical protein CM15mP81_09510 [Alphaproteobacteria bacterium]|nr:MAG: hypothetical protein CM15mP81_09510 [Alphaproteobacteria bacterium]
MSSGGSTIFGRKKASALPSNVQVFKKRRQTSWGSTINQSRYCKICYSDNGFNAGESYRADYLNLTGDKVYTDYQ